jgi:16S rRNA (cytidine1402-2'-O)-methyltransferase
LIPLVIQAKTEDIVVVSEAGTPWLSDPGKSLIRLSVDQQTPYTVLPGANALVPSIVSAWFPTNTFVFLGFAPHKKWRETFFCSFAQYDMAVFFYESVHRIDKMFVQMKKCWLTGTVHISREVSKKFEQVRTGSLDEAEIAWEKEVIVHKGEFVIWRYPKSIQKGINYSESSENLKNRSA